MFDATDYFDGIFFPSSNDEWSFGKFQIRIILEEERSHGIIGPTSFCVKKSIRAIVFWSYALGQTANKQTQMYNTLALVYISYGH